MYYYRNNLLKFQASKVTKLLYREMGCEVCPILGKELHIQHDTNNQFDYRGPSVRLKGGGFIGIQRPLLDKTGWNRLNLGIVTCLHTPHPS